MSIHRWRGRSLATCETRTRASGVNNEASGRSESNTAGSSGARADDDGLVRINAGMRGALEDLDPLAWRAVVVSSTAAEETRKVAAHWARR
jgi:hypothetical protein